VQQDRCWLAYGLREIRANPWRWLGLVPAKLGYTFDHESFAVEYLHEARPEDWPEERRALARDLTTIVHRILLCASALGCVAFPLARAGRASRASRAQAFVLLALVVVCAACIAAEPPVFWPVAVFLAVVPWLLVLLATTLATHAIFFGEDRYHMGVTPVLALFAAAALRR
jgi:hypothetical protein